MLPLLYDGASRDGPLPDQRSRDSTAGTDPRLWLLYVRHLVPILAAPLREVRSISGLTVIASLCSMMEADLWQQRLPLYSFRG
jgi:hypothetical protein